MSDFVVVGQKVSIRLETPGIDEETVITADILIGANGINYVVSRIFSLDNLKISRFLGYVT